MVQELLLSTSALRGPWRLSDSLRVVSQPADHKPRPARAQPDLYGTIQARQQAQRPAGSFTGQANLKQLSFDFNTWFLINCSACPAQNDCSVSQNTPKRTLL